MHILFKSARHNDIIERKSCEDSITIILHEYEVINGYL